MKQNTEKIVIGKVDIPVEYQNWMRGIDKEGNVFCWRVKPLSPEEKERRVAARELKRSQRLEVRRKARVAMHAAKSVARKNPTVENAEAYQEFLKEYEEVMRK